MSDDVLMVERPIRRSGSIGALTAALAKAQGEMGGAVKDKTNPHFKSSYADLAAGWDACRGPLSKNGLAVVQPASADGPSVTVTTILMHSSGEWIEGELTMTAGQNTPQGIGSCLTYARRYALFAMVGIAPEDDDGNEATRSNGSKAAAPMPIPKAPVGFDEWLVGLGAVAGEGTKRLEETWKSSKTPKEYRDFLTVHHPDLWTSLKDKAKQVKRD